MIQTGTLYIVATPIGNLEDITLRAIRQLREVTLIAAEDTRRTRKLLAAYDIHTPLVSLHEHNERKQVPSLIAIMKDNRSIAYVSDAGTPGLSDPGFRFIRAAIENEISVVPIPGVSAVITALSASGMPMNRFLFHGFLPTKAIARKRLLAGLSNEAETLVFYESPNRLLAALSDIADTMGNREIVVCRELTKIHESFIRGDVLKVIQLLEGHPVRGEITLLVSGRLKMEPQWSDEAIRQRIEQLKKEQVLSHKDCVNRIAAETGLSRRRIYRLAILK
jgi:16S rRNA (cytidine1402-2'-O)-methyltransferase